MLEQKLDKRLSYQTTFLTPEEYAIDAFKITGRTVMVTRSGDAPTKPFEEQDKNGRKYKIMIADEKEIEKLKNIAEMRKRFQILESVPYTDIIVAHELPREKKEIAVIDTAAKITLPLTVPMELLKMISGPLAVVWSVLQVLVVGAFSVLVAVVGLAMGAVVAVALVDPIVWARLDDGSWLEIARWEE